MQGLLAQALPHLDNERLSILADFALKAASEASSLNDVCHEAQKGPSRRTLSRDLQGADFQELERRVNDELWRQAERRLPRRPIVAVDLTFVPYHGKPHREDNEVKRGQAKEGTTWFHAYATAYACLRNKRYTLHVRFVHREEKTAEALIAILDSLAKIGIMPRLVLVDRGFCSVRTVCSLKERRLAFILPLPMKGKRAKALRRGKGSYETTYWLGGKNGVLVRTSVVVKRNGQKYHRRKRGNQYFPYLSHGLRATPKRVDALYRLRGGIESSYKLANQARARTSSRRPALRLLYFAIAMILQNAWVTLAWIASPPRRGRAGRQRPPGVFTLRAFLRLVKHWFTLLYGSWTQITQHAPRKEVT